MVDLDLVWLISTRRYGSFMFRRW